MFQTTNQYKDRLKSPKKKKMLYTAAVAPSESPEMHFRQHLHSAMAAARNPAVVAAVSTGDSWPPKEESRWNPQKTSDSSPTEMNRTNDN